MEANVVYILDGDRKADFAAYEAYLELLENMDTFAEDDQLPETIERVKYISPSPVLPPLSNEDDPTAQGGLLTSGRNTLGARPWAIGATVAMSVGGLMALLVWNRNRRTRNRRHVQLMEDMSITSPTSFEPRDINVVTSSHSSSV